MRVIREVNHFLFIVLLMNSSLVFSVQLITWTLIKVYVDKTWLEPCDTSTGVIGKYESSLEQVHCLNKCKASEDCSAISLREKECIVHTYTIGPSFKSTGGSKAGKVGILMNQPTLYSKPDPSLTDVAFMKVVEGTVYAGYVPVSSTVSGIVCRKKDETCWCSKSGGGSNSLKIDLEAAFSVKKIVIATTIKFNVQNYTPLQIYIGNNGDSSDTLVVSDSKTYGQGERVTYDITTDNNGQYVYIDRTKFGSLCFCLVEVYA